MREKYVPTPDEVKRAEEHLTPTQKELSEERESLVGRLKEAGLPGRLVKRFKFPDEIEKSFSRGKSELVGDIGGAKVKLIREIAGGGNKKDRYWGEIDGQYIDEEEAKYLFDKYYDSDLVERADMREDEDAIVSDEVRGIKRDVITGKPIL